MGAHGIIFLQMMIIQQDLAPSTRHGRRIYAIGDIHGRHDLLEKLFEMIVLDAQQTAGNIDNVLILLGDYIDRGPDTRRVVQRLSMPPPRGFEMICLKGNHEDMFLQFLDGQGPILLWLKNGGRETLKSYGVNIKKLSLSWVAQQDLETARIEARMLVPGSHLDFLSTLELIHTEGDYLFVHAGIRPHVDINAQQESDLIWIRDEFLNSDADFGKIIVHGHSISCQPAVRANKIGIDTGAWHTDMLTCLVLEGTQRRFLST